MSDACGQVVLESAGRIYNATAAFGGPTEP